MNDFLNFCSGITAEQQIILVCIAVMLALIDFFIASGKYKNNILLTVSFIILTTCFVLVLFKLKLVAMILSTVSSVTLGVFSDKVRGRNV